MSAEAEAKIRWLTCDCCGRKLNTANGLHTHLSRLHGLDAMAYYSRHPERLCDRLFVHTRRVAVVEGMTPCWEWTGSTCIGGYGRMRVAGGPTDKAHRYAMFVRVGSLEGEAARHRCDNSLCCNPDHLEPGSQLENVEDRNARGRTAVGNRTRSGQLDDNDVAMIRFRAEVLGECYRRISEDFPVQSEAVRRVVQGETYAHVQADFIPW